MGNTKRETGLVLRESQIFVVCGRIDDLASLNLFDLLLLHLLGNIPDRVGVRRNSTG